MVNCPRCRQPIDREAIKCPHCYVHLKAYGHPGIPLYQAGDSDFLCDRCTYHEDDTCNYPQRPYAQTCTMFHDKARPLVEDEKAFRYGNERGFGAVAVWCRRNQGLLLLIALLIVSVAIALR
ncbi:MAG: zinc ribbon domain-containing protein [Xenococcaceae cyanobacterium]